MQYKYKLHRRLGYYIQMTGIGTSSDQQSPLIPIRFYSRHPDNPWHCCGHVASPIRWECQWGTFHSCCGKYCSCRNHGKPGISILDQVKRLPRARRICSSSKVHKTDHEPPHNLCFDNKTLYRLFSVYTGDKKYRLLHHNAFRLNAEQYCSAFLGLRLQLEWFHELGHCGMNTFV